jgi:hypothetical protein
VLGHPAFLYQPDDVVDIDLAPGAFLAGRRVTLQIALVVERLAYCVDPAPQSATSMTSLGLIDFRPESTLWILIQSSFSLL